MTVSEFFDRLWQDYIALTPRAAAIHALFAADGAVIVNDHVAFRTYDRSPISLVELERHLLAFGYRRYAPYEFPDKYLRAWGYVPPDPALPRVFLSELAVDALSPPARAIVERLLAVLDPTPLATPALFWAGRLWPAPAYADYLQLAAESEYAAWLAVFGLRANHFTIAVHALMPPTTLAAVVERVRAAGYPLNTSGGVIKGRPVDLLEQASTLAEPRPMVFADGDIHDVPTCYYEFARRYPGPDGRLYDGFVAASADRLFDSTLRQGGDHAPPASS